MKSASALLLAALATTIPANAAEFPATALLAMGFKEARLTDFAETPHIKARDADPSGFLAVTADFNGDGAPDEARLLLNQSRQIAYVVVTIQTSAKLDTYVLGTYPLTKAADIGIRAAAPVPSINPGADHVGLRIFDLESGTGESSYFDGDEFSISL